MWATLCKIGLYLLIIWILGYFWDARMQLGSIPTSCHPKPQLSMMDLQEKNQLSLRQLRTCDLPY